MRTVVITEGFAEWREKARALHAAAVPPAEILWEEVAGDSLFDEEPDDLIARDQVPPISREFLKLAHATAHHASADRWGLLYEALFRLTWGGERHLMSLPNDATMARLFKMRKEIGRDIHKMHAFVRFKKVGEHPESGREQFVAWFEPDHRIMPLTASFFRKRFAGMDWSIFTPTGSAHWDGKRVELADGVESMTPPDDDELEDLWRSYYKSIFNPARIKVKAMQAEMPKKYWKNLPEAELIEELIAEGGERVSGMMETEERPATELRNAYLGRLTEMTEAAQGPSSTTGLMGRDLSALKEAASCCQECPLYENATGTVFGEGPADARIMIIGEQPGDQEDLSGRPFVGPAGQLLDKLLADVGIIRAEAYLTNAVKHFKWKQKGQRRMHQSPAVSDIHACRPWVLAEIGAVRPEVLILLGGTAAKSLLGRNFKVTEERGLIHRPELASVVVATVHPSYLLRISDSTRKKDEVEKCRADLRLAHAEEGSRGRGSGAPL